LWYSFSYYEVKRSAVYSVLQNGSFFACSICFFFLVFSLWYFPSFFISWEFMASWWPIWVVEVLSLIKLSKDNFILILSIKVFLGESGENLEVFQDDNAVGSVVQFEEF